MSLSCRLHKSIETLALLPGNSACELAPACVASVVLRAGLHPCCTSSSRPSLVTSRRITVTLQPRPSQSDSRVSAHSERVVGNGCHTASSTRTSLGVPALQGLSPSTLHIASALARQRATSACAGRRISPVLPSHVWPVPCRHRLRVSVCALPHLRASVPSRVAISRSQSMGVALTVLGSCELCRLQLLPPELLALVQLPVPRWLPRPGICDVAVALAAAVRIALPRRRPLRSIPHGRLAVATLEVRCVCFPSHAVPDQALRFGEGSARLWPSRRCPRAEGVLLSGRW